MADIKDKIITSLRSAVPKPKWQFATRTILKETVLVALWVVLVLIAGIVIYTISHTNPWQFIPLRSPLFFWHGFWALPWELTTMVAGGVLVMYYLARKIGTFYRLPTWLLVIIILTSLGLGYGLAELAGINRSLSHRPVIRQVYRHQGMIARPPARGTWLEGTVTKVDAQTIILKDDEGIEWQVELNDVTFYPDGKDFSIGQEIVAIGIKTTQNHILKAFVIRSSQSFDGRWRGMTRPHIPPAPFAPRTDFQPPL